MGYNKSKFNLTKFNIAPSGEHIKWGGATGSERITMAADTSVQFWMLAIMNERVNMQSSAHPARFFGVYGSEIVSMAAAGMPIYFLHPVGAEVINTEAVAGAIIHTDVTGKEEIDAEAVPGENILLQALGSENVSADMVLGAIFAPSAAGYELVMTTADVESYEQRICYIGTSETTLTLRPGDRLIIDASNFNVLLNNENAIWYQKGDWIDELNRDTVSLSVAAASGTANLSITILYIERFL